MNETQKILLMRHDIVGEVAKWAVRQSPYPVPDKLEAVLSALDSALAVDFKAPDDIHAFIGWRTLEGYIEPILFAIPEFMAWNERKNGGNAPFQFVSRYDGPRDPDGDFIDVHALVRNVALNLSREAEREAAFDAKFEAEWAASHPADAPAQAGEARRAETAPVGSVHEHAVGEADAPSLNGAP